MRNGSERIYPQNLNGNMPKGGIKGAKFTWGDEHFPDGKAIANTWQGDFPWRNLLLDGYEGTSPVGAFPANGFGLHYMAGNVWEWTADWYIPRHADEVVKQCCGSKQQVRRLNYIGALFQHSMLAVAGSFGITIASPPRLSISRCRLAPDARRHRFRSGAGGLALR